MKLSNEERLFEAAVKGDKEALLKLISKRKVDPDIIDNKGMTPLHHAALHGHLNVVNSLILLGAELNIKDKMGKTPLDLAEKNKRGDIAKLLVENGAQNTSPKKSTRLSMKGSKEFIDSWKNNSKKLQSKEKHAPEPSEDLGNDSQLRLNILLVDYIKSGASTYKINDLMFETRKPDINYVDKNGKTPLDYANALSNKVANKDNIINTLKLHGAVPSKEAKSLQMKELSKTFKRGSNLKLRIEDSKEIQPIESKKDKVTHSKKKSQDAQSKL